MGSPNVLTYAEFCHIVKVLLLTPAKTVPMEELFIEVFSSFLPHAIFLYLFIGGNECGVVSAAVLIVPFMAERYSCHGGEECPAHAYWPPF
jgi:hypothetical protein